MSNLGSTLLDGTATAQGIYSPMGDISAADWYVAESRNEGWYVAQGCQVVASGTAGKVDMSAGIILVGTTEVNVAAVTAFSTTITTLASGLSSGQALWAALEVDISGTLNVNAGTGSASDATHSPVKPTPTSARVVVAWLFVPFGATAVDLLYASSNAKAKILPAQQLVPGQSPTGWQYEQGSLIYGIGGTNANIFGQAGDRTGVYRPGTKFSWNDATNVPGYSVIGPSTFLSPTTTNVASVIATSKFTKTAHGYTAFSCVTPTGLSNTTGVTNGVLYWVLVIDANNFNLAATIAGSPIALGGTADSAITFTGGTSIYTIAQTDYQAANHAISYVRYSYAATPQGFPTWFNYAPTVTGWSSLPTGEYRWRTNGTEITLIYSQASGATSTTTGVSYTAPVASALTYIKYGLLDLTYDNTAFATGPGSYTMAAGSATITCYKTVAQGAWTGSGTKAVNLTVTYKYA